MKKILLGIILPLCFVATVHADDTQSDSEEPETIVICDTGYYYNGDASTLPGTLSTYSKTKKNCTYDSQTDGCTCVKCPGSGFVQQSICNTTGTTCDIHDINDCTIALNRRGKTGSFNYINLTNCKYTEPSTFVIDKDGKIYVNKTISDTVGEGLKDTAVQAVYSQDSKLSF